ncbi:peptidoglycan-binding domain-containing protein [Hyalangium minutum]|uniref:N-acetylmuramoyl-L-alanine amidase n=1 Tax=Hyalangium minutum TaxID=394096 RepID=A0A085WJV7_9BACT|nr:peptidoglycan-binding protein [Hyalangium minutum]KFE67970.1 N-acetylmuramoyl-L-alanine amidase [Hyalangium minutum]
MPSMLPPWSSNAEESFPVLRQGMCGPEVEYLQRQLQAAGVFTGEVDGAFGSSTKCAVMAFQRARGLEVDGIANSRTWAALDTRRGTGLRPILKRGVCDPSVLVLQKMLATHGFDPGSKDGQFGPKTERTVMAFQRAKGLEADGVVGPKTWNALGMTAPRSFPTPVPLPVEPQRVTARADGTGFYSI